MERFSFNEGLVDPLTIAQRIADQKIEAFRAMQEPHLLEAEGITSLLKVIIGQLIPFI